MEKLKESLFYRETIENLYSYFHSSNRGMKREKIQELINSGERNLLTKIPEKSFISRILTALSEPMVKVLIFAIFLTVLINFLTIAQDKEPDWGQTIGIVLSVILAASVTVVMEKKSQDAFSALQEIGDRNIIKVMRDGTIEEVVPELVFPGDIIFLNTGDKIPADGRIIEAYDLEIEEAILTGESLPVRKIQEPLQGEEYSLGERINIVYSGTFVVSGWGKILVTAIGDGTEMGKISKSVQIDYNILTPLQKELGVLGKKIAAVGIGISVIVFALKIFNYHTHGILNITSVAQALTICIVLIVSTIPEGLPTMVAATLALGVMKLSKENALVKKLAVCESIGAIDLICSDKTGTITENKMEVITSCECRKEWVERNILLNNNVSVKEDREKGKKYIGNPTEVALLNYLNRQGRGDISHDFSLVFQYPFNSLKKIMGTIIKKREEEKEIFYFILKGAPEKILAFSNLDKKKEMEERELIAQEQIAGRRVIAFAHRVLEEREDWKESESDICKNMIYDGFMAIADPIRSDVYQAVEECKKAGIEIKILTGDNPLTAQTIAKELKILKESSLILEARDIDNMSDYELRGIIDNVAVIARSNPMTKLRVVNLLMEMGKSVAVTGDGVNDAPSLRRAEVGIAMGITGTEISKETADIVLLNDSFATIVKAIESGRGLYENFQKFIQFQQTVNVAALFLILIFELFDWGTPLKPIQILWVNIMMDGPLAISLSFEKTREKIMDESPRDKKKSIITGNLWINTLGNALFMVLFMIFTVRVLKVEPEHISTYIFNLFVFMVVFNVFNCKDIGKKSVIIRMFDNKTLNKVLILVMITQLFIVAFLNKLFSTHTLEPLEYIKIIIFSSSIIVFSEFIKYLRRRKLFV